MKRKTKKERKEIQSVTIEPSTISRIMKKTGSSNFSQIVRDALEVYEIVIDKKTNKTV